ncbi:MAG: DEAD/DEAH box helicase, partial [Anaerolineae bacterium]
DMPDTVDAYTHRIGRTGRAQLTGEAFTLAVETDAPMVYEIEKALGSEIERRRLPGFDYGPFTPESQFKHAPQGQRMASRPSRRQFGPARPRHGTLHSYAR